MSNRRFEMHEYIIIISQLREGSSLRGLSRDKLADRKTLRRVRDIASAQGWLDKDKPMPSEKELAAFFEKCSPQSYLGFGEANYHFMLWHIMRTINPFIKNASKVHFHL